MIQQRPYEFMVYYTPQREWVEGRGLMLWLAFFFIELGAGTFLISSIFESNAGMLIGLLLCAVLGGGFHLLYLGHPMRFWRMVASGGWKTSWISRGLYFVTGFLVLGVIHLALAQWTSSAFGLLVVANILAVLTVIYAGFAMNFVIGITFWNSPLLPVLYLVLGVWGGLGVTLMTVMPSEASAVGDLEVWSRIFLLAFIVIVVIYLLSIRYQGIAASVSVKQIVTGRWAALFWIMVVALAMVLPLIVALTSWAGGASIPNALLYVVIIFELMGDLALRYCVLRSGYYSPLIPATEV